MTKLLFIDSSQRDSTSTSTTDYNIKFNYPCQISQAELVEVKIPSTVYNVTSANNTIYAGRIGTGTQFSATITPGNVTIDDLLIDIPAALTSAASSAGLTATFVGSYDDSTMILSITGNTGIYIGLSGTINSMIGFSSSSNSATGTVCTGSNAVDLTNPSSLFIKIDEFPDNCVQTQDSYHHSQYYFPFTGGRGDLNLISSDQLHEQKITFPNPKLISSMKVKLIDQNGTTVSTNGVNWSFVLRIE